MAKYDIGDRVKWGKSVGTVLCVPEETGHNYFVEFDSPFVGGHNGNGEKTCTPAITSGRGYFVYNGYDGKALTLIKKAPPHDGADEYRRIIDAQDIMAELSR